MKKKPSLLDMELFAEQRATKKQQELSRIEEESDASVFESLSLNYSPDGETDEETEAGEKSAIPKTVEWADEKLITLIEITDAQQNEINKLKQDMFKLKEQLRVYHSFLSSQQKKITELENKKPEASDNQGIIDSNYKKLLLKNIVWLKEEKEFTTNDVARLFRAEGFQTPHPYEYWDDKVVNTLYQKAKKNFL